MLRLFRNSKKGDIDYKILSDVFVKKGNDWTITAMQVVLINQLITSYQAVKKIALMPDICVGTCSFRLAFLDSAAVTFFSQQ